MAEQSKTRRSFEQLCALRALGNEPEYHRFVKCEFCYMQLWLFDDRTQGVMICANCGEEHDITFHYPLRFS